MPKNYKISNIIPKPLINTGTSIVNSFNSIMGWNNKGIQLHQAIQNKNYELITEILANKRTNPNLKDLEGNVPLYYAFKLEDEKVITDLLNHRNIDLECPLTLQLSPIQNAALWGNKRYLKLLLDTKKVVINVLDEVGDNVLAYAIYSGDIEVVKVLIDTPELNFRHKNMFGCNVLHLAAMNRQLAVVKLLLQKMDAYEELDTLNNSKQHFQNILLNVFDVEDLTAEQLQDLKEIFEYRVLLNKKEISKINNQMLREAITEVNDKHFPAQHKYINPADSNVEDSFKSSEDTFTDDTLPKVVGDIIFSDTSADLPNIIDN